MFSVVWRRSYHWKDLRPNSKHRGWFNNNGLAKSGYPSSILNRQPGVHGDLQERLDALKAPHALALSQRQDIGYPPVKSEDPTTNRKKMLAWRKEQRKNPVLEKASRERSLNVDSHLVEKDHIQYGGAYKDIFEAAELYGIYEDLFPGKFFKPNTMLRVEFPIGDDKSHCLPVYRGNIVKPSQASIQPKVSFSGTKYYTLVMSTPDGHFEDENQEYVHWMVGNIHNGSKEEVIPYCRPFPPKGTGYFRYVFVLYEHEYKIDLSQFNLKEDNQIIDLKKRTFSSSYFFESQKDSVTPVGLSFFQSDYDSSLRDFYHDVLQLPEPTYEYEFLPSYVRPWSSMFPRKKVDGFNLFLDRHRDPKEIQEEVLRKKLIETHPFEGDLRKNKFPLAHAFDPIGSHPYEGYWPEPTWRRREIERERLRQGIYKDMDWKELGKDPTDSHA
ncbi:large ribosomal subunit protein mL38 [Lepeophtheirus salmonis]|uniref:large ribosomal subunit protein mL38 n=1 Tax=Lepeophtheirus salmonis TaxID=72036 RepID=UPI001AE2EF14|nr:39S ribosomal protein L38, mitochondrial-like [Lepeophtheirus salmonis]